jgi:hypothetical protein
VSHRFYLAVAIHALQSCLQVHLMREIHKIRQALQAHPFNRFVRVPLSHELLGFCALSIQRAMAAHAQRHRGDRRHGRVNGMAMTEEAINVQSAGMELMAEIDRLSVLNGQIRAAR